MMRGCAKCHYLMMGAADDETVCLDCRLPHVAVEHGTDPDAKCPRCGYVDALLPWWVYFGALFRLEGRTWRVVTVGTSNRHTPNNWHFEPHCSVEPVEEGWELPDAPCLVSDVAAAMADLRRMRSMSAEELSRATHLAVTSERPRSREGHDVHYRDHVRRRLGCKMARGWEATDDPTLITCVDCTWIAMAEAA